MSDVAKLANVSTATVSRVIHNPETVKKETKEKVFSVIQQLDYTPNMIARQFRTNETKTIMVVVPSLTNLVFSEIIAGIDEAATAAGYQVIFGHTNNDQRKAQEYISHLKQKKIDGAILLTVRLDQHIWEEIADRYPVVLASDFIEGLKIPTVTTDNLHCGYRATKHLIDLGHTRIAHVAGSPKVAVSRERIRGYKKALEESGIPFDSDLLVEGEYSISFGAESLVKLVNLPQKPTAVFFGNDEMAMSGMKAAKSLGMKVPEDIAVIGFDDIKFSALADPPLTTTAQPLYQMGKKSMELLLQVMAGERLERHTHKIPSEFKIRESCGFIATSRN